MVFDLSRSPAAAPGGVRRLQLEPAAAERMERERLVVTAKLDGPTEQRLVVGRDRQPGHYNYFVGRDPARWQTGVERYAEVAYLDAWPGIDFRVMVVGNDLEQELIVHPGVDPAAIRVSYENIDRLRILENGSLAIETPFGRLLESPPTIYQLVDGERVEIEGRFELRSDSAYSFSIGTYDPAASLIIDPTLVYSTYLGGSSFESSSPFEGFSGIAVDAAGAVYVTGATQSLDFPTSEGALEEARPGFSAAFVTKLDASGSSLVYSTFLGGNGDDEGTGIEVDAAGNAFVTGLTGSADFPTTSFQPGLAGGVDAFVAKLDPSGSTLLYSTYLGGSEDDQAASVALGGDGSAYVVGSTSSGDFPTQSPLQAALAEAGFEDAFISKLSPDGSSLVYSTYLGGSNVDRGSGVAVDGSGSAYVTGYASRADFPTANAVQSTFGGTEDA